MNLVHLHLHLHLHQDLDCLFSRYKILHYKEEQGAFTKTIKELLETRKR